MERYGFFLAQIPRSGLRKILSAEGKPVVSADTTDVLSADTTRFAFRRQDFPQPRSGDLAKKKTISFHGRPNVVAKLADSRGILYNKVLRTWICPPLALGILFLPKGKAHKMAPEFSKKGGKPPPWICQFVDKKNGFGPSDGHIGSSGGEIRGSRTNSAARTLPWPCRPLGTSFSPLSTSGDLGPGPSPGPLGPYTTPDQPTLVGQYVIMLHCMTPTTTLRQ